ncbi:glutathione S-transferase U27 isoform X1 [Capsella rubella]|uniref:glutathione transferase n=3 Tax=Capsella rubella TaxID=81985 RepID=A0A140EH77_9BRAS|nr:glutathione S-transferase U27 isoform X1 [Capsella rubella]AML27048.1 tau class glutathione S-transferase [Capsella rubella]
MSEEEVVVLNFWPSMFGARVIMALEEKEIKFEYKEEDVFGQKTDLLLQTNPVHKKIPVLIHNGKPVCESNNILEYIDEVWKDDKSLQLLPSDPYQKSQCRFLADLIDKKVFDAGRRTWTKKGKEQEEAKREFIEILKVLERELGDKVYFGGNDNVSMVDLVLISYYPWFHTWETIGGFSVEDHTPKLMCWVRKCLTRPAISKSLPDPLKILDRVTQIIKVHEFFYGY